MGLTINYRLQMDSNLSFSKVRQTLGKIRGEALDLPFDSVSDLVSVRNFDVKHQGKTNHGIMEEFGWMGFEAFQTTEFRNRYGDRETGTVLAKHFMGFTVDPGERCESMDVGMAFFPKTFLHYGKRIKIKHPGWTWGSFCKTQYANSTAEGIDHFLRCHISVISLLDKIDKLGVLSSADDEGKFYENRSIPMLIQEIGEWDQMLAGFGVMLKGLGVDEDSMPINSHPNIAGLRESAKERLPLAFLSGMTPGLRKAINSLNALVDDKID